MKTFKKILLGILLLVSTFGNAQWTGIGNYTLINQISVEGWNISTSVFLQSFDTSTQESNPIGVAFSTDGLKMYVVGRAGKDVNEYDLSTGWSVLSASFLQSFSVSTQESEPRGIFFKPDGTKMYIVGVSGREVNEYDLSTNWDVSSAAFLQLFSVSTQETTPTGLAFSTDGTKMYVVGQNSDNVNEYDLSTGWSVLSASFLQSFSVSTQETTPLDVFFKPDGTKMYVVGQNSDNVNEYDLSTNWDVLSSVFLQSFSVLSKTSFSSGVFFKPDGTKMYISSESSPLVIEYDLTD